MVGNDRVVQPIIGEYLVGVRGELSGVRHRNLRDGAFDRIQVVPSTVVEGEQLIARRGVLGFNPFRIGYQQGLVVGTYHDSRWVPAYGNESLHGQAVPVNTGHRDGVQVAHSGVQRCAVG